MSGVAVVGAGPVGLTAALTLARAGVPVTVFEREAGLARQSRASTFHPATLDLLDDLGVAEPLIARGRVVNRVQWRDRAGEVLAEMGMGSLDGMTRHPYRLHAEQSSLTPLLLAALEAQPDADVRFGTAVDGVAEGGTGVRLRIGQSWARAKYVVAADGAHSTVRGSLGLPFPRAGYPTQALRVFTDSPLDELLPRLAPLTYVRDVGQSCSLLALPDHWRIVVRIPCDARNPLATSSVAALVRRALPGVSRPVRVIGADRYGLSRGVLGSFRCGRVLFAGDAAHLTSTAGGLNMNAGIHDAVELGAVLAEVTAGHAGPAALDAWAARRRNVLLEHVIPRSEARVAGVQDRDTSRLAAAMAGLRAIAGDPEATRLYLAQASMLDTLPGGMPASAADTLPGRPPGRGPDRVLDPVPHHPVRQS
ncbi:FAD-dependent monooxygenase [Nonomuraea roseoviolacea subsp. roseoviolacea]|uniref:3-(3-hydroxy-phenyl)propionate hydroxylase n=1 Tax=Nonomuraea roseoviolacea subsp. carminata TaxID=160689 RepID=A0ABT1K6Y0_9ACTN|nr:FAD-dependent oxidoreductase [Nonomuraea roseoviolacea]MCP2349772.1 3-(3-hydroxy-phenyl)propionate hydroxylase [Nonomuraea roseoviolacea subsp. carminata]